MTPYGPATYPPAQGPAAQDRWVEPKQRLHPLSPLLHSFKTLAVIIAAISIQGAVQLGFPGFVGTLLVAMPMAMGLYAISWLVTGYHVVGRELRIYDGVLVRRARAIPLERLQAIEVVRPLLARLFGLAELRLEVVGGAKTEAPLAFLTVADAAALRERLLAIAGRVGAPAARPGAAPGAAPPTGTGAAPGAGAPAGTAAPGVAGTAPTPLPSPPGEPVTPAPTATERHLHSVVNREVLISQLLTPPVLFLPFAVMLVVTQYWFGAAAWSLVVLASMAVAIIGVIRQPVRKIMGNWNFRLALQESGTSPGHNGLRVRHGLTETRSQTVPLHRVQAIGVTWPLLWRARRWLRARLDVAGYATPAEGITSSDQLLPVGDLATARRLTATVLTGVDLADLPLSVPPGRARWLAPIRQPVLGAGVTDRVYAVRDGRVTRELVIVPYARIQSVRVTQGPLQRQLGLATVHADTAGSLTATAHHRDLAEARWLAATLTERARAARQADLDRTAGSAGGATGAATTS